ncbi:unnamed protein product [Kluyveromyces dobzhanskii CBS 2104]|uniref:WGS project CCBQ000000000 data, contig 00015 n=1 Tax=Kluyveromyces dobzhanskii CBS 2104 TaxID=1427455 RepID=A0A0A8LAH9_9SACH|nr:unnamed protein product [Kluyveromyces dobzhanskii CBS 2104]
MCGRFAQNFDSETVQQEFSHRNVRLSEDKSSDLNFSKHYNVSPTHQTPVYHDSHLQNMKWGLIPFWTKDFKKATPWKTFNARTETLNESRLWKPSLNHHRCVVPVSGYYEWLTVKGQKVPYFICRKDKKVMFLAGLFDVLKHGKDSNENEQEGQEELWTFTIVTGPAPENLKWLHDRMPVVLEPNSEGWNTWLDSTKDSWTQKEVDEQLQTVYNEKEYECYKVPQEVGKVQNNEKRLMEPVKQEGKIDSFFKRKTKVSPSISPKKESESVNSAANDSRIKREHDNIGKGNVDDVSDSPPSKRVKREPK